MKALIDELEKVLLNANLTDEERGRIAELLYDLKCITQREPLLMWFNDYDAFVSLLQITRRLMAKE